MINFDNLEEVKTVNSRTNYDLRFSAATGKFTLSDEAYRKYDINNKGFNLVRDGDIPVLAVVKNEEATVHKGRSDAEQKGKTFTANSLASMLGLSGDEDARYTFEEHENNGNIYLTLDDMGAESEEDEDVSITSETSELDDAPEDEGQDQDDEPVAAEEEDDSWM